MSNKYTTILILALSLSAISSFALTSYYNPRFTPTASETKISSSSQILSEVAISSDALIDEPKKQVISQPSVTFLDTNNPPQYIKDYYYCEANSSVKQYGRFIEEPALVYKCPISLEYYGCQKNIFYGDMYKQGYGKKTTDGWTCDLPGMGKPQECDFGLQIEVGRLEDTTKDQKILDSINSWKGNIVKVSPAYSTCVVFTKSTPTPDHIDLIRNKAGYAGKLVFINQK